jgi:hypothetical protein
MTCLKRWALRAAGESGPEQQSSTDKAILAITQEFSHPRVSRRPDNATDPTKGAWAEAKELLDWLSHFYNKRAAGLEHEAGLSKLEAERLAMIETKGTGAYQCWLELG